MRVLIIGYGNPSRQDDGVGLAVVNGLRRRMGLSDLDEGNDGFDELGRPLDTLFLQQLGPELAELLAGYDHVCFVDAHFGIYPELVHEAGLQAKPAHAVVSHHFRPEALLDLAVRAYGGAPTAELISVRGFSFDFSPELSPETAAGVARVIERLWSRFGAPANPTILPQSGA